MQQTTAVAIFVVLQPPGQAVRLQSRKVGIGDGWVWGSGCDVCFRWWHGPLAEKFITQSLQRDDWPGFRRSKASFTFLNWMNVRWAKSATLG